MCLDKAIDEVDLMSRRYDAKNEEVEKKIIIRIKRNGGDIPIHSIYLRNSSKRICKGTFFKHFETIESEKTEKNEEEEKVDLLNLFLKKEQIELNNKTNDKYVTQKKRKQISLKDYENDLKDTINNLKKFKVTHENVQFINISGLKENLKLIDVDLSNKDKKQMDIQGNKKEEKLENCKFDLYMLDEEKMSIEKYMDYLYDIKNENVNSDGIVVLDDVYGNTLEEYIDNSYITSSENSGNSTFKELSDYPDEYSVEEYCGSDDIWRDNGETVTTTTTKNEDDNDEEEGEKEKRYGSELDEYCSEDFNPFVNYDITHQNDSSSLEPAEDDDISFYQHISYDEYKDIDSLNEVEWEDFDEEENLPFTNVPKVHVLKEENDLVSKELLNKNEVNVDINISSYNVKHS